MNTRARDNIGFPVHGLQGRVVVAVHTILLLGSSCVAPTPVPDVDGTYTLAADPLSAATTDQARPYDDIARELQSRYGALGIGVSETVRQEMSRDGRLLLRVSVPRLQTVEWSSLVARAEIENLSTNAVTVYAPGLEFKVLGIAATAFAHMEYFGRWRWSRVRYGDERDFVTLEPGELYGRACVWRTMEGQRVFFFRFQYWNGRTDDARTRILCDSVPVQVVRISTVSYETLEEQMTDRSAEHLAEAPRRFIRRDATDEEALRP